MPLRHTANPSQFRRLSLSPIRDEASSRVQTSCRTRHRRNVSRGFTKLRLYQAEALRQPRDEH